MAMKNSFGALGGDPGAMASNPAGLAVFNNSMMSMTLNNEKKHLTSNFYGTEVDNEEGVGSLSQIGGVMVMKKTRNNNKVKSVAFGFNYHQLNRYDFTWQATGKSEPTWVNFPVEDDIYYDQVVSQTYNNKTKGKHSELNLGFAVNYDDKWFIGAALNTYDLNYIEDATRQEIANAANGDSVDGFESFWQEVDGDGLSLGVGFIYKPTHNVRFGLSYQSPTWYDMHEASNMFKENEDDEIGYYDVVYSNSTETYSNSNSKTLAYDYFLKTPSTWTGSFAYVFDKAGLISLDVIHKNYSKIQLDPASDFADVNRFFQSDLDNTFQFNLGTEWRIKDFSIRGGYSIAQSPFVASIDGKEGLFDNTENLKGYAFGIGYKFSRFALDLAYDYTERTEYFDIYPSFDTIDLTQLSKNNTKLSATLSYNF